MQDTYIYIYIPQYVLHNYTLFIRKHITELKVVAPPHQYTHHYVPHAYTSQALSLNTLSGGANIEYYENTE